MFPTILHLFTIHSYKMANILFCVCPLGLGYLWQQELRVELVDGLDVAEDGGDGLLGEEVLSPALLVHAELEHLTKNIS